MRHWIVIVAAGALSLAACMDRDAAPTAEPADGAATDSAGAIDAPAPAPETLPPAPADDTGVPGQTPPTLPVEPPTTSPATSPPPQ